MTADRLNHQDMVTRAAAELGAGEAVALGPGLPGLLPAQVSSLNAVWFFSDNGVVGYQAGALAGAHPAVDANGDSVGIAPGGSFCGVVDVAGMLRGGHVALAVIQAAQVSAAGDFVHWTTAATPGLAAPGSAVDLASGAGRVIALLAHNGPDGSPNIVVECDLPVDGVRCIYLIITDLGVLAVRDGGLVLTELAPGWTAEEVAALTGGPLTVSPGLKEMSFDIPQLSPPNKVYPTALDALHDVPDGAVVNLDGFGGPGGMAHYLMTGLRDQGATGLTIISNTAGIARVARFGAPEGVVPIDHTILVENNQIARSVNSYPVSPSASRPSAFEEVYRRGEATLEVVPQGTLAERLRSGGAGVGAFYTPTAVGTLLAEGKETRHIDGKEYVLEHGIRADFCIIRGHKADTLGNVVYKGTSRNFNPVMATSARVTVVEVDEIVEPGELDPEAIVTPGIFVDRIVKRPDDFSPYL